MTGTSAIAGQSIHPLWNGAKTFTNNYANLVFGVDQSTVFSDTLSKLVRGEKNAAGKYENGAGFKGLGKNIKTAFEASKEAVKDKSFWTMIKESIGNLPKEIKDATSGVTKGKTAEVLKVLGKRMPLALNLVMLATAIPNIFNAFTDTKNGGGVIAGVAETGKTAVELGVAAAGAALGQALIPIPFVGAMIGGMAAGFIASQLMGKTFTEKSEEAQAQASARKQKVAQEKQDSTDDAKTSSGRSSSNSYNPFVTYDKLGFVPATSFKGDDRYKDFMSFSTGIVA